MSGQVVTSFGGVHWNLVQFGRTSSFSLVAWPHDGRKRTKDAVAASFHLSFLSAADLRARGLSDLARGDHIDVFGRSSVRLECCSGVGAGSDVECFHSSS